MIYFTILVKYLRVLVLMDSVDDMYNRNDVDSSEDFYSEDDDTATASDEDDSEGDDLIMEAAEKPLKPQKQNYAILSEADIGELQKKDITGIVYRYLRVLVVMDSVDDMYDTNDADLSEDFYSEDDDTATASDEDDCEGDDLIMEAAEKPLKPQKENYAILSEADIGELQKKDITVVSDALKISEGSASIILQHHNWSEPNNFIHDTWFCNQEKIRKAVDDDTISWQKYGRYLVRSYVEAKQNKIKWCPAPGCDYAVKFDIGRIGRSGISNDVKCDCSYGFCWSCAEEAHRPVDCTTVAKWILKNSAESENTNWILVNSKPCPKCKRPIEKNHGCMHMRQRNKNERMM
ncbi:hypothetical protein Sjap_008768 [Stephania japonica]|uniref:RBR-type E3 ubiquitin transferase n=1 Tax=Stephania japonica TaxID=461633 RepID=A0AAP0PCN8_9MAGN